MDDLEFRRAVYADPDSKDNALHHAAMQDEQRKKTLQEARQLNNRIKDALSVAPPEGLKARLMLRKELADHRPSPMKKYSVWLAAAASIMAISLLSLTLVDPNPINLGSHAISHVDHEGTAPFERTDPLALAEVNAKLARFNSRLGNGVSKIYYASFCLFKKVPSIHLVMDSSYGKVTVFIVPIDDAHALPNLFEEGDLKGIAQNLGYANLLVVGNKQQDLTATLAEVRTHLRLI